MFGITDMHATVETSFLHEQATQNPDSLWDAYFSNPSSDNRNTLISEYQEYSRKIARSIYSMRAGHMGVDINDCYQVALLALIESIACYRIDRNTLFTTYAAYRIKGALHSALDHQTEKSCILAFNRRRQQERTKSLLLNNATMDDFNELLDLTLNLAATEFLEVEIEEHFSAYDYQQNHDVYDHPVGYSISCELWKIVNQFVDPDKSILIEHYMNQRLFSDIAEMLSMSTGRVSQLHKRAIQQLRDVYVKKSRFSKKL